MGKLVIREIAVGETMTGEVALGKLPNTLCTLYSVLCTLYSVLKEYAFLTEEVHIYPDPSRIFENL